MSRIFAFSRFVRIAPPVLLGLLCCVGVSAQIMTIPAHSPTSITVGPDGAIWFTDAAAQTINRIDATGAATAFPTPGYLPGSIASGSDGNLWFAETVAGTIGRMTTSGIVTWFPTCCFESLPLGITSGPDGNLWLADQGMSQILRVTTAGAIASFPVPSASGRQWLLGDITAGPDGNIWFTEPGTNKIGRITTSGTVTEFDLPRADIVPNKIVAGPDGNLWFTESVAAPWNGRVGRITPTGDVTEFPLPVGANTIVAGPDGNLWLGWEGALTRMTTSGATTVFPVSGAPDIWPAGLAAGPDGSIWIAGAHDDWNGIDGQIVRVSFDTSACAANATTLCLNGGRFRVTADWKAGDGSTGHGRAVNLTANSGYFWFFDAANIEMVVKVLDGCSANQHHWVFAAGLTNVEVTTTVTDTYTGLSKTYTNPQGTPFAPIQDTAAFATCQ
jgi:streptogramin lyase